MAVSPLAAALKKAVGGNDTIQGVKVWLSTGFPPLNKAISGSYCGGFPSGRIIEMFGPSSAGKTLLATQAMISAQRMGGIAVFLDHENSFVSELAAKYGLNIDEDDGQWVYKQPDTFEDSVELTGKLLKTVRENKLIPDEAPIIIVYDSLASMVPRSKFAKMEAGDDLGMNDNTALARATAANFPTLAAWARKYNCCMLFLNQIRTKIGVMFGDPTTSPGGNAPEFYASVRIKLGRSQIKEGSEKTGQSIGAECIKNKVSEPFQRATWDYYFDTDRGFDVIGSSIDHLCEVGILEKSSGYIKYGEKKYRRKELVSFFEERGVEAMLPLFDKAEKKTALVEASEEE